MVNPDFNKILAEALAKQNRITNADRIRAMTDEELADFLEVHCFQYGWLDWLRQEVSTNG